MAGPQIAVIGLPGLAKALQAAGYDVLADGATEPAVVTAAVREASSTGRPYVVIVAGSDPALRQWVTLQLRRQVAVLIAHSEVLELGDELPGARTVELPADIDTVMARFGAPPKGAPVGAVVIGTDGGLPLSPQSPPAPPAPPAPQLPPPSPFEVASPPAPEPSAWPAAPAPAPAAQPLPERPVAPASAASREQIQPDLPLREPGPRPLVPTERGWVAPIQRSELLPEHYDPEVLFGRPPAAGSSAARPAPGRTRLAPVVITFSGKGGVGKTATALALAQRAARRGALKKVLLVDANRGQGDVRKYLRLRAGALPSIFDAATSGNPRSGIVPPRRLAEARPETLAPLGFGVVLAPDDEHADPSMVPTAAYRSIVEYARERFDLVVLDTQIVEAADTSGLIDDLVVPLLLEGAFGLALSDTSMAGVQNTLARVRALVDRGVASDHLLLGVNRANPESGLDEDLMRRRSEQLATWVGLVQADPKVASAFEQGFVPGDPDAPETPAYTALLDAVLRRATGVQAFDAHLEPAESQRRSGGLFRRKPDHPKADRKRPDRATKPGRR